MFSFLNEGWVVTMLEYSWGCVILSNLLNLTPKAFYWTRDKDSISAEGKMLGLKDFWVKQSRSRKILLLKNFA